MKFLKKKILSPLGAFLMPATTLAAGNTISAPITTVQGLINLICLAFDYMFYALIALSLVMVVIAGFNYVTSNGSAEKVDKATKMILYAVIGIAVALLARGIPLIVGNFLGASKANLTSC
jgi:hypothetical protein